MEYIDGEGIITGSLNWYLAGLHYSSRGHPPLAKSFASIVLRIAAAGTERGSEEKQAGKNRQAKLVLSTREDGREGRREQSGKKSKYLSAL